MATQQDLDEDAHFALSKLAERLEHVAKQDRETRTSPKGVKRFGFDAYSLVQAKEELDSILTAQVTPTQCSQSLTVQLNPLPENLVRRFFSVAKGNTENVFKEKDFMEIIFWIAVVFASQENVDVNLQEDGLDLLLVESLASLLTTKEWFRHTKIGRADKQSVGTRLLPRLIQIAFDDGIPDHVKRRILLIIVELVSDITENRNLLTRELDPGWLGPLFLNTEDFMVKYCCTAIMSILLSPATRTRRKSAEKADKFWPDHNDGSLTSGVTQVTGKTPDKIMHWLLQWSYTQGAKSWEGMIKTIWIGDIDRRIVVGPAIGKVYLTAMVQSDSPAQMIMLDINFLKLRQLSIDRQQRRITVYSPPENPAVSLDFRRISGTFDIEFTDLNAMKEILAFLPICLTERQDSHPRQCLTKDSVPPRSFGSFDEIPDTNDVDNVDIDSSQFEEDIYGNDSNQQELKKNLGQRLRETSSELSSASGSYELSPVHPVTETVAAKPPRPAPRVTARVQNVYTTNKKERLKAARPTVTGAKQVGRKDRASSTSLTAPDSHSTSTTAPISTKPTSKLGQPKPLEEGYFDGPPPRPTTNPPSRAQKKAEQPRKVEPRKRAEPKKKAEPKQIVEPKPNLRKRPNQESSDGEWEPTSKKTRAVRAASTSKSVAFTAIDQGTTTKKPLARKAQNVRRQSGSAKPSQYGPAEIVNDIQEEANENVFAKRSSITRPILPLSVSSGGIVGSKTEVQRERSTDETDNQANHDKPEVPKRLNLASRKDVIAITSSSDHPADEDFSDDFNDTAMEIDNPFDSSRDPSPDIAPKTLRPGVPTSPSTHVSHLKFSDAAGERAGEVDETLSPVGRTVIPIPRSTKRSPLVGTSRPLNTDHDSFGHVTEKRSDGRLIIRPRIAETDEEEETSSGFSPSPAPQKALSKHPELVVKERPSHILASSDGEYQEVIRREVPKSQGGRHLASHKPRIDNTRMPGASQSDMRPGPWVRRNQQGVEETERPNGFHDRLLKAGIKLSSTEILAVPNDDIDDSSGSSISVSDSELDSESEMEDDSPMPKHQRVIRDSLREISEWMFHKFLRVEASDLNLTSKMRREYDSISNSLTGWLSDEISDITTSMEKDTATVLRSWEAVRVSGLKMTNKFNEECGRFEKCDVFSKFDEIQKKWN